MLTIFLIVAVVAVVALASQFDSVSFAAFGAMREPLSPENILQQTIVAFEGIPTITKVGVATVVLLLGYSWRKLNKPVRYFKKLEETGYISDGKHSLEKISETTRKRRKAGDLPPPFPNGWYCVIDSNELKVKEVKQVFLLGQLVAVFRMEDGEAVVVDAYCPHLGANLAVGGVVKPNGLECPFHGWTFDKKGRCVDIPYAQSIPSTAKTRAWTSLEINGQVLIWFDAEGREPAWYPMEMPEITSKKWVWKGKTEGYLNAHIQEVPENGADIAHLQFLHSPFILNGVDLRTTKDFIKQKVISHGWKASWTPLEAPQGHITNLKLSHSLMLFGHRIGLFDFHVNAFQVGPSLVYLTWEFALGRGAFLQTLVPVEPMLQKISHSVWAEWKIPTFITNILLMAEAKQVERDMMIWNNKCFVSNPMLVKEDKLIGQFRRWYRQFYSESSGEYGQKNNLDW